MWTEILASFNYKDSIWQNYFACDMMNWKNIVVYHSKTISKPSSHWQLFVFLLLRVCLFFVCIVLTTISPILRKASKLECLESWMFRLRVFVLFCISMNIPRFLIFNGFTCGFTMYSHVAGRYMWTEIYVLPFDCCLSNFLFYFSLFICSYFDLVVYNYLKNIYFLFVICFYVLNDT